jgi:ATP-dependent Clp protease ATP-binding subunit ClpX
MKLVPETPEIACSFCGTDKDKVQHMIAGPAVFICDECVELCMDLVREVRRERSQAAGSQDPLC